MKKLSLYVWFLAVILVVILNGIYGGSHPDGLDIIAILMLLLLPIRNLFSNKVKTINNQSYYYLLTILSLYISVISIYSIFLNEGNVFLYNNIPFMFMSIMILHITSLTSKKNIIIINKDKYKVLYFSIVVVSLLEIILPVNWNFLSMPIILAVSLFYLIILIKNIEQYDINELKKIYLITSILLAFTYAFAPIVLIYYLYKNLEINGETYERS